MFILLLIGCLIVPACYSSKQGVTVKNEQVIVTIDQGDLGGQQFTTDSGFTYYSFLGIPYAQPPVGELRFQAPQPPPSWEGVRDATKEGSACLQTGQTDPNSVSGDEDCLYLNVYTPQIGQILEDPNSVSDDEGCLYLNVYTPQIGQIFEDPISVSDDEGCLYLNVYTPQLVSNNEKLNYSVMVWIHGGAFLTGSGAKDAYGPDYLIEHEIVLVTLNYRLGALGFLGLNYTGVSKNNGLKDQLAALQWVKNNIDKFGGNPEEVTIFGESAGGMSVHYHLISPMSKGLFQRAISQSGSALDSDITLNPTTAHERALALGNIFGYDTNNLTELVASLTQTDAQTLILKQSSALSQEDIERGATTILFPPTVEYGDGAFLSDFPINIIKSGDFSQVPYITGVNSREGKLFALQYMLDPSSIENMDKNLESYIPRDLGLELGSPESIAATEKIRNVYFGNSSFSENIEGFVDYIGDQIIVYGVHRTIELQMVTGTAPLFTYIFSYEGSISFSQVYDFGFPGAGHADELMYLFKVANVTVEDDSSEMATIRRMTKIWTNFAKSLDPSTGLEVTWNPVSETNFNYLSIGEELSIEEISSYETDYMAVWDELYENIDNRNL